MIHMLGKKEGVKLILAHFEFPLPGLLPLKILNCFDRVSGIAKGRSRGVWSPVYDFVK